MVQTNHPSYMAKAIVPNNTRIPVKYDMPDDLLDDPPVNGVIDEPLLPELPDGGAPLGATPTRP